MLHHRNTDGELPRRVVVLGGTGFLGRATMRQLADRGVDMLSLGSADVDLTQPEAVEQLRGCLSVDDAVVFASAITREKGRDVETFTKNVSMAVHVAKALTMVSCAHILYLSSDAVYEDVTSPIHERTCSNPSDLYGLMHLVRERILATSMSQLDTRFGVLRLAAIYGSGDTHNSYGPNRFLQDLKNGESITLFGEGEEQRDHVFVEDAARLIVLCLVHRSEGLLNLATGKVVSFLEVAQTLERLRTAPTEVTHSPRATPITHRYFDVRALREAFPSFEFTSLDDGLAQMIGVTDV
jgi:nucleoside-diphosphate-sugar epimerase